MALTTLLLLTRQEEFPYLRDWLAKEAGGVQIVWTPTVAALDALADDVLRNARLIAFLTGVVVPRRILERLGHGAYNFHPGSPAYPGSAPATFAIYDGAAAFGVTLHEMEERVDAGPIVGFELFAMPPGIGLHELEQRAYVALVRLFRANANLLAGRPQPLRPLKVAWGPRKSSRRDFARLCDISSDIGQAELARRLRALGQGDGRVCPTVTLHGYRFRLVEPAAEPAAPQLDCGNDAAAR